MKYIHAFLSVLAIASITPWFGCASDSSEAGYSPIDGFSTGDPNVGISSGGEGGSPPLPPEEELESNYSAPVATGKYVWIANPTSGRVAYIDATTLEVNVVEAGNAPTYVAAIPDANADVAIVLNVLSYDATVLRATGTNLTADSLPVPSSGNAWAVAKDGRWAIAWTDARRIDMADPIDGFQDITVLDLKSGAMKSTPLTVGYRPVAVAFDQAEKRAFAITQDGISVIALDGTAPVVAKNIKLTEMPSQDATTRDVAITPDGAYALVRPDGETAVHVFSLVDGSRTDVFLPSEPTDLDLSPDGTVAVAVVRDTNQVALLPVPGIVADPLNFPLISVPNATIGSASLAAQSPLALLYTNATPNPVLTLLDTSAPAPNPRQIQLWAPVKAVFPTEDAAHAIVVHEAGGMIGSEYPAAMSVVPIANDLPAKLTGLDAPVISVAVSPSGHEALVATGDEMHPQFRLYYASMPSLEVKKVQLASQPIAAGIVACAKRGYVAQKHPDGRITFVDFQTGSVLTLTGFELASQVIDGSNP
ncbi:MAG TPA: hypothetical protein PK156_35930 [Polyangium sp.]|nr:hypothetical protein [Polyangium sp.]